MNKRKLTIKVGGRRYFNLPTDGSAQGGDKICTQVYQEARI